MLDQAPKANEPVLLESKPVSEPVDWEGLIEEIQRDFPKTLARLAE